MDKILISGAQGFLGKNLVNKLESLGYSNLVKLSGKTECDLTNQKYVDYLINLHQPDIVIHTAARVGGILANSQNPGKFMYENLAMGINLIESCRRYGKLKKFIMMGTVCSYPKNTEVPFKEEDLWNGYPEETNAPYGIAKKTINEMLKAYSYQYGFDSTTLLAANMYGPHDHFNLTTSHVIPALILKMDQAIKENKRSIDVWGSPDVTREFLYVADCVGAILASLNVYTGPNPINIGTGEETSIYELLTLIAKIMGFHGEFCFSRENYLSGQQRRSLCVKKAQDTLGYYPTHSLEDGLTLTVNWFKQNKEKYNDISYSIQQK